MKELQVSQLDMLLLQTLLCIAGFAETLSHFGAILKSNPWEKL